MSETVGPLRARGLSKTRFVKGCQCHKRLWLETFEPDAPELVPDAGLQAIFDSGTNVGELARAQFSGGVLVDLDPLDPARERRTRELIATGAPAIFEATFIADRTYVAVDVLLAKESGFTLIEVKSTLRVKDEHVLDAAVQTHVARRAGIDVRRVEVMCLNPGYVHPGPAALFLRTDVTERVEQLLPTIPETIAEQLGVLAAPMPDVAIGPHCETPRTCPFQGRCWPQEADSVLRIPGLDWGERFRLFDGGMRLLRDLPADQRLNALQGRHRRALESGTLVVEPGLREALARFQGRLGFLDFETIAPAVPVWDGTRPREAIAAQFSYHEGPVGGPYTHAEFLAEGPGDPRAALAARLVELTRDAEKVVMYSSYERRCIRDLARAVPALSADLLTLDAKLVDLLPVVKRFVYHPDFDGSIGIKAVLPALVEGMRYGDLVQITGGGEAGAKLERLLFGGADVSDAERGALRHELLEYCKLDTLAMVKLLERLWELAA
jgi:hypothetical protein